MNDPHVALLRYRLLVDQGVTFDEPPSVPWNTDVFEAQLADGILTCTMKSHFAAVPDARKEVEPFLRAWEIHAALEFGRKQIAFVYDDVSVIDRNPSPLPSGVITGTANVRLADVTMSATATLHITKHKYPQPPAQFHVSPNVETMWQRYQGYLDHKEPLQAMAYFCLTVMQTIAGGTRGAAVTTYRIDRAVLDTLGDLTSESGDSATARKFLPNQQPLADKEQRWIEAAVKALILRMGEYGSNTALPVLTMQDLPSLT